MCYFFSVFRLLRGLRIDDLWRVYLFGITFFFSSADRLIVAALCSLYGSVIPSYLLLFLNWEKRLSSVFEAALLMISFCKIIWNSLVGPTIFNFSSFVFEFDCLFFFFLFFLRSVYFISICFAHFIFLTHREESSSICYVSSIILSQKRMTHGLLDSGNYGTRCVYIF